MPSSASGRAPFVVGAVIVCFIFKKEIEYLDKTHILYNVFCGIMPST